MSDPTKVNRDPQRLAPKFRAAVQAALAECNAAGLDAVVYEGLRTNDRQAYLYAQGRTRQGDRVTNAADALHGWHGFGLAVDVISRSRLWDVPDAWWERVAAIFEKHGCTSGRRWKMRDNPHMQWGRCRTSPSDRARELLRDHGIEAVWREVGAMDPAPTPARPLLQVDGYAPRVVPEPVREPAAPPVVDAAPAVVVAPKPVHHSRTIILNTATAVASVVVLAGDQLDVLKNAGLHLPDNVAPVVTLVLGVANVVLRLRTGQPLEGTKAAREAGAG